MTGKKQVRRDAKQLVRLCMTNGRLDDDRAKRVAELLGSSVRREARPMLEHFQRLVTLDRNKHTANIESAAPLTADLRTSIEVSLTGRYGWGLKTTFATRPELIGGLRIQVGSDLYDGSIRTALLTMARRF